MRLEELPIVHSIQLVAGEDEHIRASVLFNLSQILPNGVGGALVPLGPFDGLLRRQHFNESMIEHVELVRVRDVPMEADGHELREHVDAVDAAIQAIRDRHVDESILAGHGHGRFGAKLREREQSCPLAAAKDQTQDGSLHGYEHLGE
jgi:hypothetical protein